jgi:hypothetical protein
LLPAGSSAAAVPCCSAYQRPLLPLLLLLLLALQDLPAYCTVLPLLLCWR